MIERLSELASRRTRGVLLAAGVVFLLAAALGLPVLSALKSRSSDFQDPASQSQQVLRSVERATGQSAEYGVAALVPALAGLSRHAPAGAGLARRAPDAGAGGVCHARSHRRRSRPRGPRAAGHRRALRRQRR